MNNRAPDPRTSQESGALLDDATVARMQRNIGRALFATRWIMAPVYVGLLAAMALIVVKFGQKLFVAFTTVLKEDSTDTMLNVLALVDMALVGNLIVMVVLTGWENSISQLDETKQPGWISALGFAALKQKIIGSVIVIAAVSVLETFMYLKEVPPAHVFWQVCILLALSVTAVLLALTDKLSGGKH